MPETEKTYGAAWIDNIEGSDDFLRNKMAALYADYDAGAEAGDAQNFITAIAFSSTTPMPNKLAWAVSRVMELEDELVDLRNLTI